MKVIVVNGNPRVGKDTFVKLCSRYYPNSAQISIADFPKHVAEYVGWKGGKTDKDRNFLSDILDALAKWKDMPYKIVCDYVKENTDKDIVFIHSRDPKDIERFVRDFNATTVFINRDNVKRVVTNHADKNVDDYNYDYYIDNSGDIEEFDDNIAIFLKDIKKGIK